MKELSKFMSLCAFLLIAATGFVGCSEDEKPKPSKGFVETDLGQIQLTGLHVVDQANQRPIRDAQVLIGTAQNAPFEGNFGATDKNGVFALPDQWTSPQIVTIDAPGYLRVSYMGLTPKPYMFQLKRKSQDPIELKGQTSGHPVRNKDGYIDYALVMSAMTRQDLLNFDVQKVVSPVNDTISALGMKFPLPSNVSLPKQTEQYFINVTLDKPKYRLFLGDHGVNRVFAARGRFAFKPVVDGLRGDADVISMINHFTITGGSIRDVNLSKKSTTLNIPVMDLTFSQKHNFKAPTLERGQVMLVLPVTDTNGYLIPTDIKRLSSEQSMSLSLWNPEKTYIAQVVKNESEFSPDLPGMDRLSASLQPLNENGQSRFFPLMKSPAIKTKFHYRIQDITAEGINKLATYAVISDIQKTQNEDGSSSKIAKPVWEIYAPVGVTEISLPEWEWQKKDPLTRFEVIVVGSTSETSAPMGPQLMEKATHVTRSSIDF